MKKVTYERAKKLINSGFTVKALVSRTEIPVKTLNDLKNLRRLADSGVQNFELFYEPVKHVPKTAMDITLDEAITLSYDGEEIFGFSSSGKEIKFSSPSEIISYYRKCDIKGDSCIFYWYVG